MSSVADQLPRFYPRPDLIVQQQSFGVRTYWTIKDPIALNFFQLRDEEQFILQRLAQRTSAADLIADFNRQFAPARLSESELSLYLRSLQSQGLLIDTQESGQRLWERRDRTTSRTRRAWLQNPLAIRWRGIHPGRLIDALYPWVRGCFNRFTLAITFCVIAAAVLLLLAHVDELKLRLPSLQAFVTPQNLLWIAVTTAVAKGLHELAHALTCKHFGGQCRELGVMLLVFTPCLYCDVSDAWLMRSKWQRIAVSAAGIIMELWLAALATWLWWFSEPGLLNTLCFNTMTVCSVSTLFFNGNPLLKYDGYYILADWAEVPNLRSRASAIIGDLFAGVCLGVRSTNDRTLPDRGRWWLVFYGIAALVYRVVVLASILYLLHRILKPYGLEVVAQLLTLSMAVGMVLAAILSVRRFLRRVHWSEMKPLRVVVTMTLIGGGIAALMVIPLPQYVVAPMVIEPTVATPVFVSVKGRIAENSPNNIKAGTKVHQGQPLMMLESPKLEAEIVELQGTVKALEIRNQVLATRRLRSEAVAGNLPASQQLLASLQHRLQQKLTQAQSLRLLAPLDGVVLAPEFVAGIEPHERLGRWRGTPLDSENRGCTLDTGTMLCWIGDASQVTSIAVINQSDIPLVKPGQEVTVWTSAYPSRKLVGKVDAISLAEFDTAPRTLIESGALPMIEDATGNRNLVDVSFNVRIPLEQIDRAIPLRSTGWAKIEVEPITLVKRMRQYVARTFRWQP